MKNPKKKKQKCFCVFSTQSVAKSHATLIRLNKLHTNKIRNKVRKAAERDRTTEKKR